ncbi:MAG: tyrosine--tRNA ligase [bacterium]|nr:tyrosine--tRNA ligase [bacterium]
MDNEEKIERLLARGTAEVIEKKHLEERIKKGDKLRIKNGADPTAPDLHLGHAVILRKLREFQDLGHQVVFIIGDFTARVGDPSGKSATRPMLSEEEIKKNAKTYFEQAGKIIDIEKTEIHYNSEWFLKEGWAEVLEIAGKFTVQRVLERDDFERRIKAGVEITMKEVLYPLMQAYDSVKIRADVEIGGTDQKFNMLAGRTLQRKMGMAEQDVIMMPILTGLDGERKMSKSLGNYIGVTDAPNDMFGKVMSIPDKIIMEWAELAADYSGEELVEIGKRLERGENPRNIKIEMAERITAMYHGKEEATSAKENFIKLFQKKEIPDDIPEIAAEKGDALGDILIENKIVASKSEFRRLVKAGAVDADGEPIVDIHFAIERPTVVKVGKRRFVKVKI